MDNEAQNEIVAQPGWIEEKRCYQRKALLYKTLATLWVVPSLTSLFVIAYQFPQATGVLETLKLVRLEQWLSLFVLLLHPIFLYLAVRHRRTEIPTEHVVLVPDPTYDPKKLY
ncbi:MAG: hypothetical protein H0X66_21670 [Verrucomicrobia bacterium]|nr:hypothetical protein [Verrucomicrobiota bacterium]